MTKHVEQLWKHLGCGTLLLLLIVSSLSGNDGYLGSRGGNVFLSKSEQVQMVREDIRIKAFKDSCVVDCKFLFYNHGSTVSYKVGFPNDFYTVAMESRPLRNFTCRVGGLTIPVKEDSELDDSGAVYESKYSWFAWDMNFPEHESVLVENAYVGAWGGRIDGTWEFSYVLGTGRSWRSPIERGRITFDHSAIASSKFVSSPDEELPTVQFEDSVVIEFSDYTPGENTNAEFRVLPYWGDSYNYAPANMSRPLAEYGAALAAYQVWGDVLSKQDLLDMINEIYARSGYVSSDSVLNARFSKKDWYRPDSSFTLGKLGRYEKVTVREMKAFVEKYRK